MNQKLTLTIEKKVIAEAKKYASENSTSISRLVENYLSLITSKPVDSQEWQTEISECVKEWGGGITAEDLEIDENDVKLAYLADKYLHV